VQIVSTGEVLWDVFGGQEFLGGAPLNFSAAARKLGDSVALVTAVGADARGARALEQINALGLTTEFVQTVPGRATGTAIVVTDSEGNASYVIDRPAAFDSLRVENSLLARVADLEPEWIYFGTLAQTMENNELILNRIVERAPGSKCFYDLNLRTGHWNLPLVQRLSGLADVLKLNDSEAEALAGVTSGPGESCLEDFCRHWSSTYGIETICVTLGSKGCAIFQDHAFSLFGGFAVKVVDTVGAGDAFAAAFLHGLSLRWPVARIAAFANSLGALIASRAGATPAWTVEDCQSLVMGNGDAGSPVKIA
jgi:fructokinase